MLTKATLPRSARRGGHSNRQQNQGRKGVRALRDGIYAILTPNKNLSAAGMRNFGRNFQETTRGVPSSTVPLVSYCRLCLFWDHTMTKCAYTINAEGLATTCEASWRQNCPNTRFRSCVCLLWQESGQCDAQQGAHGTSYQSANSAQLVLFTKSLVLLQLVSS